MKEIKLTYKPRCSRNMQEKVDDFKQEHLEWYEWFDSRNSVWHLSTGIQTGVEVANYQRHMVNRIL